MSLKFHLPIGQPDLVQNRSYTDAFQTALSRNGQPIRGDQIWALCVEPPPPSTRKFRLEVSF